jgi:hypothetical protein
MSPGGRAFPLARFRGSFDLPEFHNKAPLLGGSGVICVFSVAEG